MSGWLIMASGGETRVAVPLAALAALIFGQHEADGDAEGEK